MEEGNISKATIDFNNKQTQGLVFTLCPVCKVATTTILSNSEKYCCNCGRKKSNKSSSGKIKG